MSEHKNVKCPCCGVTRLKPTPHIPSTCWSDDCVCCDQGRCVAHQFDPSDMPSRPSEETMLTRAKERSERLLQIWENQRAKFELFQKMMNDGALGD